MHGPARQQRGRTPPGCYLTLTLTEVRLNPRTFSPCELFWLSRRMFIYTEAIVYSYRISVVKLNTLSRLKH